LKQLFATRWCSCSFCFGSEVEVDGKWRMRRQSVVEINCTNVDPGLTCQPQDIRNTLMCSCSSYMLGISPDAARGQSTANVNLLSANPSFPRLLQRVPSVSDSELTMPEMNQFSLVLSHYQVSALFLSFPPRLRLYPWTLLYSITSDGCSLNNLYSKLEDYDYTMLLLILDTRKTAFGALLSPPNLKLKGNVYTGTPETFLFTFSPKLRKFHASGENNCFVQSMRDGISIGGWRPALWIDHNLEKGMTAVSQTFDNSLLTDEHFVISELECWALTEFEYVEYLNLVKPSPIYKMFPSSKLATMRPAIDTGGIRCGVRSKGYNQTYKREKSHDRGLYILGDDDFDEQDEEESEQLRVMALPRWQTRHNSTITEHSLSLSHSASPATSSFYF